MLKGVKLLSPIAGSLEYGSFALWRWSSHAGRAAHLLRWSEIAQGHRHVLNRGLPKCLPVIVASEALPADVSRVIEAPQLLDPLGSIPFDDGKADCVVVDRDGQRLFSVPRAVATTPNQFQMIAASLADESLALVKGRSFVDSMAALTHSSFPSFASQLLAHSEGWCDVKDGKHIVIADTPHNRVHILNIADTRRPSVLASIGSGRPGLRDGDPYSARFHMPTGITMDTADHSVLVCDTLNHTIRKIKLDTLQVSTVDDIHQLAASQPEQHGWFASLLNRFNISYAWASSRCEAPPDHFIDLSLEPKASRPLLPYRVSLSPSQALVISSLRDHEASDSEPPLALGQIEPNDHLLFPLSDAVPTWRTGHTFQHFHVLPTTTLVPDIPSAIGITFNLPRNTRLAKPIVVLQTLLEGSVVEADASRHFSAPQVDKRNWDQEFMAVKEMISLDEQAALLQQQSGGTDKASIEGELTVSTALQGTTGTAKVIWDVVIWLASENSDGIHYTFLRVIQPVRFAHGFPSLHTASIQL